MKFVPFLSALCLAVLSSTGRCDDTNVVLKELILRGEGLMGDAAAIAKTTPQTQVEREELRGKFIQWQRTEVSFQHDLNIAIKSAPNFPPTQQEASIRLSQFDNFIYDGMSELTTCRPKAALVSLDIASQILQHAKLALEGVDVRDWAPNLNMIPAGENCP